MPATPAMTPHHNMMNPPSVAQSNSSGGGTDIHPPASMQSQMQHAPPMQHPNPMHMQTQNPMQPPQTPQQMAAVAAHAQAAHAQQQAAAMAAAQQQHAAAIYAQHHQEMHEQSPYIGLWGKVRSVLEENIQLFQSIYGPQFPIQFVQIRSHFADVMEQQKWHLVNPDDAGPHDEMKAVEFVRNILGAIQHRCENTEEVDQKLLWGN